jgi:hypothetical protein
MTEYEIQLAIHYNNGLIQAANIISQKCTLNDTAIQEIESLITDWQENLEYYNELLAFQSGARNNLITGKL